MNEFEKKLKDLKNEMVCKCIELLRSIPHKDAIDISELEITYNETLVVSVDVSDDDVAIVEFGDGFLIPLKELRLDDIFNIYSVLHSLYERKGYSLPFTIVSREGVTLKGVAEVFAPTKVLAVKKIKEYFVSHFEEESANINPFSVREVVLS